MNSLDTTNYDIWKQKKIWKFIIYFQKFKRNTSHHLHNYIVNTDPLFKNGIYFINSHDLGWKFIIVLGTYRLIFIYLNLKR